MINKKSKYSASTYLLIEPKLSINKLQECTVTVQFKHRLNSRNLQLLISCPTINNASARAFRNFFFFFLSSSIHTYTRRETHREKANSGRGEKERESEQASFKGIFLIPSGDEFNFPAAWPGARRARVRIIVAARNKYADSSPFTAMRGKEIHPLHEGGRTRGRESLEEQIIV